MKKLFVTAVVIFTMISCAEKTKIPVYAWTATRSLCDKPQWGISF